VAGRARSGQSRGGRRVGSGEPGWPVCGEQATGRRRAGTNEKIGGIHKLDAYVPQLSDLAEEHKSLCSSEI
jgi:hypothetical protein